MIQSSQSQLEARNRILGTSRLFDESIEQLEDLKALSIDQLTYIAEQQTARHRLYSFVQGGATGAGGLLLLTADFPVMIALNVKAVQLIATSFGHDVNKPYEMMLALKGISCVITTRKTSAIRMVQFTARAGTRRFLLLRRRRSGVTTSFD